MNASVIKSSGLLSVLLELCNEWPVRADIERIGVGDYDPPSFCFPNQPITGPQAWEAETYGAASPMLMPRDPSRRASKAPDDSPEMQKVWLVWHKSLAELICQRYRGLLHTGVMDSQPASCKVYFAVSFDGQIGCRSWIERSGSNQFDSMTMGVIKSFNGNKSLTFPMGSKKQFEEEYLVINWDGKELIVRPCERPKSDALECPGLGKELRRNSEADR